VRQTPNTVAAFRRWVRAKLVRLADLDTPDRLDTIGDDYSIVLADCEAIASSLGLPDVVAATQVQPCIARDVLVNVLAILNQQPFGEWLESDEAAKYLGLSVKALYQSVHRGRIKPDGRGARRSYRFRRSTLDAHLCPSSKPRSKTGRKAKYSGLKNSTELFGGR